MEYVIIKFIYSKKKKNLGKFGKNKLLNIQLKYKMLTVSCWNIIDGLLKFVDIMRITTSVHSTQ